MILPPKGRTQDETANHSLYNLSVTILIDAVEARVLGSLMEKEATTPDYYPQSLNALVNACNQKNNRDPVMTLDEAAVRQALDSLQSKRLAGPTSSSDSRVTKYEHRAQEVYNFTRGESAILCVLLLRGPQTPGELRGRTERIHRFEHLDEVLSAMQRLMQRDPPLARVLPRQPGTKESRYMHLLSGDIADEDVSVARAPSPVTAGSAADVSRITRLEEEVFDLRKEIGDLKQQMESLRKQFE
jgi:uncharacterized protein YceH (UPF0502 family)